MSITLKIIISGILMFLTIVSGIWLAKSGRPLNAYIFNLHKFLAIGTVFFLILLFTGLLKHVNAKNMVIIVIILTGIFIISLFVSGGLLSINKPVHKIFFIIHSVTPVMLLITIFLAIFLLAKEKFA